MPLALGSFPVSARAENEGQADLDKATQQKLGAQTSDDLTEVIQLCESALKKGLDKGNSAFANDLMASALVQRGSLTASKAYRAIRACGQAQGPQAATDDHWKTYRSEALADLEKGVKLSPKQPQAQFEIAKLNLLPGGDPRKRMEALDKTIALADDDASLRAEALVAALRCGTTPGSGWPISMRPFARCPATPCCCGAAAWYWRRPRNGTPPWPISTKRSRPTPSRS